MRKWWIKNSAAIYKTLIASATTGIFILAFTFYVESKVNIAVEAEREKVQNEFIIENTKLIITINDDLEQMEKIVDNTTIFNINDHQKLQSSIDSLSKNIKTLTYVVKKNNTNMKRDLDELKRLQNGEDIASK